MYIKVNEEEQLAQGDLFMNYPILLSRLSEAIVCSDEGDLTDQNLTDLQYDDKDELDVIVAVERSPVMVISQSCDALRASNLTVLRILPITFISPCFKEKNPTNKVKELKQLRDAQGFFYLQEIDNYLDKSIVSFDEMLNVRRQELLAMRRFRNYRLNQQALQHLQDKLARYFSRYGFDDSYMFRKEELEEYRKLVQDDEQKREKKEAERDRAR